MQDYIPYTLDLRGKGFKLSQPKVMGILNVTPDSFYTESRKQTDYEIETRIRQMMEEGADILDIGAYSSRPFADDVSPEKEMQRLRQGLSILRKLYPEAIVSVDTFRADVARMCVEEYGVQIVNDISGGRLDPEMFKTVAQLGVPYILTHMKGTPQTMQKAPYYEDVMKEVCSFFQSNIRELQDAGVKDIILDPGFGFGKTVEHNYQILHNLDELHLFHLPLLAGFGACEGMRHKMKPVAKQSRADEYDVKECVEVIKLTQALKNNHV